LKPNCAESSSESSSEDDEVDCSSERPKPKLRGVAALEKSQKTKKAKVKGQVK